MTTSTNAQVGALKSLQRAIRNRVENGEIRDLDKALNFIDLWVEATEQTVKDMEAAKPSPVLRAR